MQYLEGPVSITRLQKFESCPWAYYQKYALGAEEPVGEIAEYGKLLHGIIAEAISTNLLADPEAFDDFIIDIAAGELSKYNRKDLSELYTKFSDRYNDLRKLTIKALSLWRELPNRENVVVEKHFVKTLPCGVPLQGYVDFLIPGKYLWDWKTGHDYERHLNSPQLALYAWGTDELDAERAYVFLEFDKPVFKNTYSIKQAVKWANDLCLQIDFAYEIAEEEGVENGFPKKPGTACRWCGFKEQCAQETAEKAGVLIPDSITSPEQALEVATTLLHLETLVTQTKGVLEAYCQANGPFELNGEWFAIYPGNKKKEWDKAGIYNLLKGFPEEQLLKVFSVSSTGVDALIKELPFIEPVIKEFLTETRGDPSFKHQKKPPEGYGKPQKKKTA